MSRRLLAALAALLAFLGNAAGVAAHPSDAELAHWADATIAGDIAQHRASGMAVAIVHGGKLVYLNGYGLADFNGKAGVDPKTTLFSMGSLTKLFTATAIEQLYERGKIASLDDPANRYLRRYKLPKAFGREITVRNLLDHRGGFDESVFGLGALSSVPAPISGEAIKARVPKVIRPPGEISVYSNVGYGVLGMLIEDVSGLTYRDYVQRNILTPLGMSRSYIRYSPSEPIATPAVVGAAGPVAPMPQSWAYHPFIASSASLVSTADDMGRFMLGQLAAEKGLAPQLVSAEGAHRLHDRHVENAAATTGFGMSFFTHRWNGERVAENAGSGPGFQAPLLLLPDSDVGFITLIEGASAIPGRSLDMFEIRQQFLNYYLGPLQPVAGPPSGLPMSRFAGLYRNERRPHSTVEAFMNPGTALHVRAGADNTLTIDGRAGYHEVAAGVFWKPGVTPFVPDEASSDLYAFLIDKQGRVTGAVPYLGMDVYRPAWLAPETVQHLAGALLAVCATGLLGLLWRVSTPLQRWTRRLAGLMAVSAIGVPASLFGGLMLVGNPMLAMGFGHVGLYVAAACFTNLLVALTAIQTVLMARCWLAGGVGGLARNIHYSLIVAAGIGLVPLFAYFNFVGFHIP